VRNLLLRTFVYMSLIEIKQVFRKLSLSQLKRLDEWLHELIKKAEASYRQEQSSSHKQMKATETFDSKTYRLESIHCGKEHCKCMRGKLRGSYWYSYTRVGDKVTSQYIGRRLLRNIEKKLIVTIGT
jgi:hypothetical protein